MMKPLPTPDSDIQPRILVVEDIETNILLARRTLEREGYRVAVALNGREGVEAARHEAFAVIFMDIQMPILDGLNATREIRQFQSWKSRVPIIALTASVPAEDGQSCIEAGMDDFVSKPLKTGELVEKCRLWISRRPAAIHYLEECA